MSDRWRFSIGSSRRVQVIAPHRCQSSLRSPSKVACLEPGHSRPRVSSDSTGGQEITVETLRTLLDVLAKRASRGQHVDFCPSAGAIKPYGFQADVRECEQPSRTLDARSKHGGEHRFWPGPRLCALCRTVSRTSTNRQWNHWGLWAHATRCAYFSTFVAHTTTCTMINGYDKPPNGRAPRY